MRRGLARERESGARETRLVVVFCAVDYATRNAPTVFIGCRLKSRIARAGEETVKADTTLPRARSLARSRPLGGLVRGNSRANRNSA